MDCRGQDEAEEAILCRKYLSSMAAKDIFVLTYDRMRRYGGTWHVEKKLLLPCCIFLESENVTLLLKELREREMEYKKGVGLLRIKKDEEKFLKVLYGGGRHLKMSKGVIKNGVPEVTAGPLKGMEQRICKIERHKRLAKLALSTEQGIGYITAGLEITEKI